MQNHIRLKLFWVSIFLTLLIPKTSRAWGFLEDKSSCIVSSATPINSSVVTDPINSVIARLQSLNISNVGELDLRQLSIEVKLIRVCMLPGGFVPAINGDGLKAERMTSMYFVEKKLVVLQRINFGWIKSANILEQVALHEGLGALGYIDDNYQLSTPLVYLSYLSQSNVAKDFLSQQSAQVFQHLERRSENVAFKVAAGGNSGGSTTTGGGGDSLGIELKSDLYHTEDWLPSWIKLLNENNVCFDLTELRLNELSKSIIQLSSIESSNLPQDQFESFQADASQKYFKAHVPGILEGGIIASQLGSLVDQFKSKTLQRFALRILYMQSPHSCNEGKMTLTVDQAIQKWVP